jgi:hypothetical protein
MRVCFKVMWAAPTPNKAHIQERGHLARMGLAAPKAGKMPTLSGMML